MTRATDSWPRRLSSAAVDLGPTALTRGGPAAEAASSNKLEQRKINVIWQISRNVFFFLQEADGLDFSLLICSKNVRYDEEKTQV